MGDQCASADKTLELKPTPFKADNIFKERKKTQI